MARETKIGIALMVLLIGVFGFMVYKKWNDRQPAAVAAAAEGESPAATEEVEAPPADTAAATTPESSPFAAVSAGSAAPAQQLEPDSFAALSGDVSADPSFDADFAATDRSEPDEAPASSFATGAFAPVPKSAVESSAASAAAESGIDAADPFAAAALADGLRGPADSRAVEAPFVDPFGEAAVGNDTPMNEIVAETSPNQRFESEDGFTSTAAPQKTAAPAFDERTPEASTFAVKSSPFVEESTPFADDEPANASAPGAVEPAPASLAGDVVEPFGEVDPGDDARPGRLFPQGSAVPVARSLEASVEDESPFAEEAAEANAVLEPTGPDHRAAAETGYRVVAENDSYWSISKKVYGTPVYFHALSKANADRIPDPNRLRPGMKVLTPSAEELSRRFPSLVSQAASNERDVQAGRAGFSLDEQGQPLYRVGKSDTLTGIAQSHLGRASRWVQIYQMNRKLVADPKSLKPGTVLRLPGDASRVRLVPEG